MFISLLLYSRQDQSICAQRTVVFGRAAFYRNKTRSGVVCNSVMAVLAIIVQQVSGGLSLTERLNNHGAAMYIFIVLMELSKNN